MPYSFKRMNSVLKVLVGYIFLTLVFTYPLIFHLGDKVAGIGEVWLPIWSMWWFKKSLFELKTNPFYTDYQFYPDGVSLFYFGHTSPLLLTFSTMLMASGISIISSYNLLVLLSFALSGLGTFLLTRFLLSSGDEKEVDWRPCFLAGVVYAFAPYHFLEIYVGHLNLLSIEWIPFAVLFFLRLFNPKFQRLRDVFLASLFLFFVGLSDWQYLGFVLMFICLYVLYLLWFDFSVLKKAYRGIAIMLLFFSVAILPLAVPLAKTFNRQFASLPQMSFYVGSAGAYSMDLLGFITPSQFHPLFGRFSERVKNAVLVSESSVGVVAPVGLTVILLVVYYLFHEEPAFRWTSNILKAVKNRIRASRSFRKTLLVAVSVSAVLISLALYPSLGFDPLGYLIGILCSLILVLFYYLIKERKISFWLLSAAFFFVMSLGPVMHFAGRPYFALPYTLFTIIPGFTVFRTPYRFSVMLMLSLAVIASYSMNLILGKAGRKGNILFSTITLIVLIEFLAVPLPLSDTGVPQFYHTLSEDKGDYAILEVPIMPKIITVNRTMTLSYNVPANLYYQTVHGKRMIGGYFARDPIPVVEFLDNVPLFFDLRHPDALGGIFVYTPSKAGLSVLKYYNVSYVVFHRNVGEMYSPQESAVAELFLGSVFPGSGRVFDDGRISVYRVPSVLTYSFVRLGFGWYGLDFVDEGRVPVRWIGGNASLIMVNHGKISSFNVSFSVYGFDQTVHLESYFKDSLIDSRLVYPKSWQSVLLSNLSASADDGGELAVIFRVPEGCRTEGCVRSDGSQRCVSVAFTNITVNS